MNHPKPFRRRRGLNWFFIGSLYASYYMCRYNFRFAVPGLQSEFGYSVEDISFIFAMWSAAYGVGQLVNGLITDKIGGKKSLFIGGAFTIVVNLILGFSSLTSQLSLISLLAMMNGYVQSFGAPGLIKINSAWFLKKERGLFSGIFGGMIQLGQVAINQLAPLLLNSGLVLGSLVLFSPGDWRSVFMIPPFFVFFALLLFLLFVKQTPEDCGFPMVSDEDPRAHAHHSLSEVFHQMVRHPHIWYYAVAYACTGGVRHSLDQLAILYFRDQLGFNMETNIPTIVAVTLIAMPIVAFLGSLLSGYISDKRYNGERGPLAVKLYFCESLTIFTVSLFVFFGFVQPTTSGILIGSFALILISFSVNSTHSLVGSAAPMDIGGKKMSGFAAGIIDSFQYFGGALSLLITGHVIRLTSATYGYFFWYLIMSLFGLIAGTSMWLMNRKQHR